MPMIITDYTGVIQWANDCFLRFSGFSESDLVGQDAELLVAPEARSDFQRIVPSWKGNSIWRRKHGELYKVDLTLAPVQDAAGQTTHLLWTAVEAPDRELAEAREREEHFRSLFDKMSYGVAYCQMLFEDGEPKDWVYLEVNPAFGEMTGLNNVIGKRVTEVAPGVLEANPDLLAAYGRVVLTGKPESFERHISGLEFWCSNFAYRPKAGYFVALIENITARKQAEEKLRKSEERHQTILQTAMDGFWMTDAAGRLLEVNDSYANMSGYSAEELLGMRVADLVADRTPDEMAGFIQWLKAQGRARFEARNRRKDGTHFDAEVSVQYQASDGGWFACFGRDITELRSTKAALEEKEAEYRRLFFLGSDALFLIDAATGQILDANNAASELYGYSHEELLARADTEISAEPMETAPRTQAGKWTPEQVVKVPHRFHRKKDGTVFSVEITARSFQAKGQTVLLAALRDITERRRVEMALLASEQRYRILFDRAKDGISLLTLEGQLVSVNEAFAQMHGYSVEEMQRMSLRDLDTPETAQQVPGWMRRLMDGEPLTFDVEHYHKDGHVLTFEVSSSIIDMGGTFLIQAYHRDTTERKLAERRLQESEERFRVQFMNGPDALYLAKWEDGIIIDVNDAFEKTWEYSKEEAIGKTLLELNLYADPEDRKRVFSELKATGRVRNIELNGRTKSGKVIIVSLSITTLKVQGEPHIIGAVRDITDRKQLEASLAQAQKMESIGRLAGGVAHDFNNLLTVINGYSGLLTQRLSLADPLRSHAAAILKSGEQAASLTKQLLAFSRKQVIEPIVCDLNRRVLEYIPMLERLIGEDITLNTQLDDSLGRVMADPDQLHQVIMNHVVNARDAMPDGGRIDIATRNVDAAEEVAAIHPSVKPGRYVLITVTDTGCGMEEETLQHMFEPFYTTKAVGKGTGLGLSTAYGIVKQNNGWIMASSEVGIGTTFRIYLPRVEWELPAEKRPMSPTSAKGGETILLVEDEDGVRSFTRAVLEGYGYRVLEASSGEEAIAIGRGPVGEIHLLLSDIVLTGMNGKKVAEQLGRLLPDLKVLFISGYSADVVSDRGILDHDTVLLQKPFSPELLATKIREVLDFELK